MEQFICTKNGIIGRSKTRIKKGTIFPVLRTIMNECVLITGEDEMNIISKEKQLKQYGELIGSPVLGGM